MVRGLYIWSSAAGPERSLCVPTALRVVSMPRPRGSKAWSCFHSTPSSISSMPMPSTRLTVSVK